MATNRQDAVAAMVATESGSQWFVTVKETPIADPLQFVRENEWEGIKTYWFFCFVKICIPGHKVEIFYYVCIMCI